MKNEKQPKARIPHHDNERLKDALGDTTIDDFLSGAIYDLIEGGVNDDYYEAIAELRRLHGETTEIDGRIDRIDDRIEELQEEREELVEERDEKQERMEELEDELADTGSTANGSIEDESSTLEDVTYELLVDVAHDELGSKGVTAGLSEIQEASLRVGVDANTVIEEMRIQSESAKENDSLKYADDPLSRSFLLSEQNKRDRVDKNEFDRVRRAIADEVLDDGDVVEEKVPEKEFDI